MFERLLDAVAEVTGCDRDALVALVEQSHAGAAARPKALLDRVAAAERGVAALQAVQVDDLAALNASELAAGDRTPLGGDRDAAMDGASRVVACEVAKACGVAIVTAGSRVSTAVRAVTDHPELLGLLGTGRVSLSGLTRVVVETAVLLPQQRTSVDKALAADAERRALTAGELGRAAARRVLAADPDAATRRTERARARRDVRLSDPFDGTASIHARLRAEEARAIFVGLDTVSRALRAGGDERPLDRLRADLFVEQLLGRRLVRLDRTDDPASRADGTETAAGPERPPLWCSFDGREPAFDAVEPTPWPVLPDPPPDDPVWDRYLGEPDGPDTDSADGRAAAPHPPALLARLRALADRAGAGRTDAAGGSQWRAGVGVEVQVVVSLATVLGLDEEPGMLRGYGAVPAGTVREIVAVAEATGAATTMRRLFCDPTDGRLLTMESSARLFRGGLRQFCAWRDQADRLTGGPIADIDHVHGVASGGATTAANGQGLGVLTNRVVKNVPDVTVRPLPLEPRGDGLDGYRAHAPDLVWTLPSGHTYPSQPPPALGPGSQRHQERADGPPVDPGPDPDHERTGRAPLTPTQNDGTVRGRDDDEAA